MNAKRRKLKTIVNAKLFRVLSKRNVSNYENEKTKQIIIGKNNIPMVSNTFIHGIIEENIPKYVAIRSLVYEKVT